MRDEDPVFGTENVPRWLVALVVVMLTAVVLGLTVLIIDLRHRAAVEDGAPPPAFVVVATPAPYGPPPW